MTLASDVFLGRTVLIIIVGHLSSAPRAQKEAAALRKAGARVVVRGNWFEPRLVGEDLAIARQLDIEFAPATDLRRVGGHPGDRIRHRMSKLVHALTGSVLPRTLGPGAPELLRDARRIRADLTLVHSEPGLWLGRRLAQEGHAVGVDFEDWFSRDQCPGDRPEPVRTTLRELEHFHLQHARCCVTTTHVMAEALAADAGTPRIPVAIPNSFPADSAPTIADRRDAAGEPAVSFYWFSQTIGPARGLEALAAALALLRGEWVLHLRGALGTHAQWLEGLFTPDLRSRIHVLPPVSNAELPARTRAHDVGLALEIPFCTNKQLTASNKIHEYLRAGLAVVATATRGQEEVLRACPHAGQLVTPGDAASLAAAMQAYIDDPQALAFAKGSARVAGATVWNWERYEPVLLSTLAAALPERK
ncbi:glycosyltransferase [Cognatilysobacter lacus]|nr:glycosyltransferase [Lysobacter lacus]